MDSALKGLFGGGESAEGNRETAAGSPLAGLFGGDPNDDREGARDFINRVKTGPPEEGFSQQEALARLAQASQRATPEQMHRAAERATSRLNEDQRSQLDTMLRQRMGGVDRSGTAGGQGGDLADMLTQLFSSRGGAGGLGGMLGGLLGGSVNTNAVQGDSRGGDGGGLDDLFGGLLGSTAGKAALGGLAAFALSEILGDDR